MPKSAQILALATALLSTTSALPTLDTTQRLERRADFNILAPTMVGVYLCTQKDWKGSCHHLLNPPGICNNLLPDLAGKVSSEGPDRGNEHGTSGCKFYGKEDCQGDSLEDENPGTADLSKSPAGGDYDKWMRSYVCY